MKEAKSEIAYNAIKQMIINGELEAYEGLSEEALQVQLSMSRTPIHEALSRLEADNFVNIYPQRGTYVVPISLQIILEMLEIRSILEPVLTRIACQKLSDSTIIHLLNRLNISPAGLEYKEFLRIQANIDHDLHETILRCVDNRFIRLALQNAYDHNDRWRLKAYYSKELLDGAIQEHRAILEAILARDEDLAAQCAAKHMETSIENTKRIRFL